MIAKTENIRELDFEEMEKVTGGTELEAYLFLKHISKKYGVKTLLEIKKVWTQEEFDYFNLANNRKAGDEPLGPYPE